MTSPSLVVNVGSSLEQTFKYTLNGNPVDLTGWEAVVRLRDQSDAVLCEIRSTDSGDKSLSIDATNGTLDLSVAPSLTGRFTALTGTFELEISSSGRIFRIVDGKVSYRPRGRAMLDNRVLVIKQTSQQVTVETSTISEYQRIDRGPPGLRGQQGNDGPTVLVNNTRIGAIPAIQNDYTHLVPARSGPSVSVYDTVTYDKLQVHAKSYLDYASGSYGLAILTARDDLLARTGGKNGGKIQLPHDVLTIDRQLDFEGWTGLEIHGIGGSGYFSKCQLIFSAAPAANITGSSSTSNTIGTGSKTFTIGTGLYVRQNDWIRFTASGGYVEGQVTVYNAGTGSCTLNVTLTSGAGTFASWEYSANTKDFLFSFRGSLGCALENLRINVPAGMSSRHNVIDGGHGPGGSDGYHFTLRGCSVFGTDYNDLHTVLNLGGATGAIVEQNLFAWCGYGIAASNGPYTFDCNTILDAQYYPIRVGAFSATILNTTVEPLSAGPNIGRARFLEVISGTTNLTLLSNYCGDSTSATTEWIHSEGQCSVNLIGNYFSGAVGAAAYSTEGDHQLTAVGNTLDLGIALVKATGSVQPLTCLAAMGQKYAGGSPGPFKDNTSDLNTGQKLILDQGHARLQALTVETSTLDRPTLRYGLYHELGTVALLTGTANHNVANPNVLTRVTMSGGAGTVQIADTYIGGTVDGNEIVCENETGQYIVLLHASASAAGAAYQLWNWTGADVVLPPGARWTQIYKTGVGWRTAPLTPPVVPGVQRGTASLTAGVSGSIAAVLTSSSVIEAWCVTPGGTVTSTVQYRAKSSDRTNGTPGSFKVTAVQSDRTTTANLDTSTVEWSITT